MLLPERVERGVLLPVVAAAVPERVESCPWCSKRVEDLRARAIHAEIGIGHGFLEVSKDGIHLLTQVERELTSVIPLRRAVVAAAEEHLGLPLVSRHEHASRHL